MNISRSHRLVGSLAGRLRWAFMVCVAATLTNVSGLAQLPGAAATAMPIHWWSDPANFVVSDVDILVRTVNTLAYSGEWLPGLPQEAPRMPQRLRNIATQLYQAWPYNVGLIAVAEDKENMTGCLNALNQNVQGSRCLKGELQIHYGWNMESRSATPFNPIIGMDVGAIAGMPWQIVSSDWRELGSGADRYIIELVLYHVQRGWTLRFYSTHWSPRADRRVAQAFVTCNYILSRRSPGELPPILCGDFNAGPGTPEIDVLDAHFYRPSDDLRTNPSMLGLLTGVDEIYVGKKTSFPDSQFYLKPIRTHRQEFSLDEMEYTDHDSFGIGFRVVDHEIVTPKDHRYRRFRDDMVVMGEFTGDAFTDAAGIVHGGLYRPNLQISPPYGPRTGAWVLTASHPGCLRRVTVPTSGFMAAVAPTIGTDNWFGTGWILDNTRVWPGRFVDTQRDSLLMCSHPGNVFGIAMHNGTPGNLDLQGASLGIAAGLGPDERRQKYFPADFDGDDKDELLRYDSRDGRWYLGRVNAAGSAMTWSTLNHARGVAVADNTHVFFGELLDRHMFFVDDFGGDGSADVVFYYPGDSNWWTASLTTISGQSGLQWRGIGNTSGWGNLLNYHKFFVGDFTGDGLAEIVMYYPDGRDWWVVEPRATLQTRLAGRTVGWGDLKNDRFFVVDLDGDGAKEIVFYARNTTNWHSVVLRSGFRTVDLGSSAGFGNLDDGHVFFHGRFQNSPAESVGFFYPGDSQYWTATGGSQLAWTHMVDCVGNAYAGSLNGPCGPSQPTLASSPPVLGYDLRLSATNAPAGWGYFSIMVGGAVRVRFGPAWVPTPIMRNGCASYIDELWPIGTLRFALSTTAAWSTTIPLPNEPALANLEFVLENYYFGGGQFQSTDSLRIRLGY